jgi:hypothetical protein
MIFGQLGFLSALKLLVLLQVRLDLSELGEKLVVLENLKVLNMVVGLIGTLELLLGFSGIDSLENA